MIMRRPSRVIVSRMECVLRSPRVTVEDAHAARAVERLDDHVAADLVQNPSSCAGSAVTKVSGVELGEAQRVELLVRLAQAGGAVEDERLPLVDQAQEVGREEEVDVEGRVLAHEHRVEGLGLDDLLLPVLPVVALGRAHLHRGARGVDLAAVHHQVLDRAGVALVTARLALGHEHEGRVFGDVPTLDGVDDVEKLHENCSPAPSGGCRPRSPQRCWHTAAATIAAVSARSVRGPRPTSMKPLLAAELDLVFREAALGTDDAEDLPRVGVALAQRGRRVGLRVAREDQAERIGGLRAGDFLERPNALDHGHHGASRLLGRGHGHPPPALHAIERGGRIDLRDAAPRGRHTNAVDADLDGLLDDEVDLLALRERGGEREIEGRLGAHRGVGEHARDRGFALVDLEHGEHLVTRAVEHDERVAGVHAQHVLQMVKRRAGEDGAIRLQVVGRAVDAHLREHSGLRSAEDPAHADRGDASLFFHGSGRARS